MSIVIGKLLVQVDNVVYVTCRIYTIQSAAHSLMNREKKDWRSVNKPLAYTQLKKKKKKKKKNMMMMMMMTTTRWYWMVFVLSTGVGKLIQMTYDSVLLFRNGSGITMYNLYTFDGRFHKKMAMVKPDTWSITSAIAT